MKYQLRSILTYLQKVEYYFGIASWFVAKLEIV